MAESGKESRVEKMIIRFKSPILYNFIIVKYYFIQKGLFHYTLDYSRLSMDGPTIPGFVYSIYV
jgi:hypothetical protein